MNIQGCGNIHLVLIVCLPFLLFNFHLGYVLTPKVVIVAKPNSTSSYHVQDNSDLSLNIPVSLASSDQKSRVHLHTTQQQISFYEKHKNGHRFGNKADFPAIHRMAKSSDLCSKGNTFLIGGVNEGQFTLEILAICPDIEVRGFEIQPTVYSRAQEKMKGRSNVKLYNMGWGEKYLSGLRIGGSRESAGLYDPRGSRFAAWGIQSATTSTVVMQQWCEEQNISTIAYVLIDVEGFEPKVLRGMHLDQIENQKRFPHLQYELGGTWAKRDPRHGGEQEWSQFDAAKHLDSCGYQLFMIGVDGWMPVNPGFFNEGLHMLEEHGNGKFVQGNLLCLHSQFASASILKVVVASSILTV